MSHQLSSDRLTPSSRSLLRFVDYLTVITIRSGGTTFHSDHHVIDIWDGHRMALLLCLTLGIARTTAAKPLILLGQGSVLTPAAESPPLSPLSSNQSIQAFNSTLNVTAPFFLCYDSSKGSSLIADQCVEALVNSDFARLPPTELLTFAPRSSSSPPGQIGLPRRYQSSDGKCAIEPSLAAGMLSAHNTARDFNKAANKLIAACVDHESHRGGLALTIGGDNNLAVRVFSFKSEVQCYGSVNRQDMVTSCNNLANKMKATSEIIVFTNRQTLPRSVVLPHREMDPAGGGCRLVVSFNQDKRNPLQYTSWEAIWSAVVAINAMCIRNGQRGRWLSIGYNIEHRGIIDVDVSEVPAEEQLPTIATAA